MTRTKLRRLELIILSVALVAFVFSRISVKQGYIEEDKRAAESAIRQFHTRLSASQFDQIYGDANEALQKSQDRETLIREMQETRNKYGAFRQVTFSQLNVIMGAPIQIRAVYNANFEQGAATELFTYVKAGEKLQLVRYQISPGTVRPRNPQQP